VHAADDDAARQAALFTLNEESEDTGLGLTGSCILDATGELLACNDHMAREVTATHVRFSRD